MTTAMTVAIKNISITKVIKKKIKFTANQKLIIIFYSQKLNGVL